MWIFWVSDTRWKSTCNTTARQGCIWKSRSSTRSDFPSSSISRIDAWNFSLRSEWNSGLCSTMIGWAAPLPP